MQETLLERSPRAGGIGGNAGLRAQRGQIEEEALACDTVIVERELKCRPEARRATRQALLDAGRAAFARDGYHATGVEAIARAVRVTRGAFYHHFKDKNALFDAVVVDLQKETAATIEKRAKKSDLGSGFDRKGCN